MMAKSIRMVFQHSAEDCGYAVMAMLLNYYGLKVSLNQVKMSAGTNKQALSALDMCHIANQHGIKLKVYFSKKITALLSHKPCILHWQGRHYVLAQRLRQQKIKIYDPEWGAHIVSEEEVSQSVTGFALEADLAVPKWTLPKMQFHWLAKAKSLLALIVLFITSQCLLFCSPYLVQKLIDTNSQQMGGMTLATLSVVYLLAKFAEAILDYLKIITLSRYGYVFNMATAKNLMKKVSRLSWAWFGARHLGEIYHTMASVYKLHAWYIDNMVVSIVDGLFATMMATILLCYVPKIFMVLLVAILLEAVFYRYFANKIRYYLDYTLKQRSRCDHILLENIRSILSIKANLLSALRNRLWLNQFQQFSSNTLKISHYKSLYQTFRNIIIHIETLVIALIATVFIKKGTISYGGFYLILFYKNSIHEAVKRMFDKCFDYQSIEEYANNIKCIMSEKDDQSINHQEILSPPTHSIALANISFKYPHTTQAILKQFSYEFLKNQSYCIVGPSGCGKSTLLYLLLGLIQPDEGIIQLDGVSYRSLNHPAYQAKVGAVLQNDVLFSGTLAENITLFDKHPDLSRMKEVSEIACIDHLIRKMPLRYHSYIDGSGNALSGGEKQRLLLARALYKNPTLLLLDETTSHLDPQTEQTINRNIAALKITKIMVAHRIETINSADHLVRLPLVC